MNIRFNVEFQLNIGGNFLQGNIKVMNTGHLTLILPVECFICGKTSFKIPRGQSESVYRRTDNTKHAYKSKDRVTRTPLKTWGELRCSGRVSSSCSTSGTRRVAYMYLSQTTQTMSIFVY